MRGTLPPMTAELVLGPLLRYTGAHDATIWVETDAPCEVEVVADGTGHRARTFSVEGHHYALVRTGGRAGRAGRDPPLPPPPDPDHRPGGDASPSLRPLPYLRPARASVH